MRTVQTSHLLSCDINVRIDKNTPFWSIFTSRHFSITSNARDAEINPPANKESSNSSNSDPPKRGFFTTITGKLLLVSTFVGAYLWILWDAEEQRGAREAEAQREAIRQAKLGGPWTLTRVKDGTQGGSEDFYGQFALIYFGFTNCPDICPEEIEKACLVVDAIDSDPDLSRRLIPVFVTLDPDRDTPKVVEKYIGEFSPKMIGFVGTEEEIRTVSKKFGVYHGKGPKDSDGDYIVDHSIIMYLVGPDGLFMDYYGQNKKRQAMTESIKKRMLQWEEDEAKAERKKRWLGMFG